MPPFNWFDRGNQEPEPEKSAPEVPEKPPQQETPTDSAQAAEASQPIAEDYLSWAKAAYQNIQKQKLQESPSPADSELQASAGATSAGATSERADAQPSEPKTADSEGDELDGTSAKVGESGQASPADEGDRSFEENTLQPEEETEAETSSRRPEQIETANPEITNPEALDTAQSARPFWASAEAERQERLEKLKAEAIVEPEPELDSLPTESTQVETAPESIEFDENFLWSAGVLAAQGRRPDDISEEEITWLQHLRQGLGKTRRGLINQLRGIVGQGPLNQDAVMEIEALLLQADVGIEATDYVIEALQERMRQETLPPEAAIAYLKEILRGMLDQPFQGRYEQTFTPEKGALNIWLMTGVNGAGKTTTIGKLAHMARKSDYRCLIAAADTFRAAAVEQVKIWGQRSNVDVIANPGQNTDPAAVVFDAISAAKSRDTELLLVDTAGRLQNKKNLMAELGKIRRILDKKAPDARIESLLVLDATLGQNGLRQAEVFSEAAQLSGVVLTKLDGTAKGGVALAVVKQLGLPIRFIGAGEGIEDLRPFSSYEFVEALLSS